MGNARKTSKFGGRKIGFGNGIENRIENLMKNWIINWIFVFSGPPAKIGRGDFAPRENWIWIGGHPARNWTAGPPRKLKNWTGVGPPAGKIERDSRPIFLAGGENLPGFSSNFPGRPKHWA